MTVIEGRTILLHIMKMRSSYGVNDSVIYCGYKDSPFFENSSRLHTGFAGRSYLQLTIILLRVKIFFYILKNSAHFEKYCIKKLIEGSYIGV